MVEARRFPPPWSAEETDACFVVRDANGQALSYVYFEEGAGKTRGAETAHPGAANRGEQVPVRVKTRYFDFEFRSTSNYVHLVALSWPAIGVYLVDLKWMSIKAKIVLAVSLIRIARP
jgi:hypothetical protein